MLCVIPDRSAAFSGYVLIACMISVVVKSFILYQISCSGFGMDKILSVYGRTPVLLKRYYSSMQMKFDAS
jgi:hypothetical protein